MISWIGWLDSYENLSLFFVIMFLPASKKHSNHIQDPRNSAAFATMGSSASSRKLLQPHVFAALKAMGTEVKLWGIWVLYGPLKRPGRFINMEPENTHTKKNNSPFSGSVNLWGCSYDDHIWYVNSLALRATGTLHPLSLSAVWSQWTFPKKNP